MLIVDDVLATGGTAAATAAWSSAWAAIAGLGFVIELGFLMAGRNWRDHDILSLITSRSYRGAAGVPTVDRVLPWRRNHRRRRTRSRRCSHAFRAATPRPRPR